MNGSGTNEQAHGGGRAAASIEHLADLDEAAADGHRIAHRQLAAGAARTSLLAREVEQGSAPRRASRVGQCSWFVLRASFDGSMLPQVRSARHTAPRMAAMRVRFGNRLSARLKSATVCLRPDISCRLIDRRRLTSAQYGRRLCCIAAEVGAPAGRGQTARRDAGRISTFRRTRSSREEACDAGRSCMPPPRR